MIAAGRDGDAGEALADRAAVSTSAGRTPSRRHGRAARSRRCSRPEASADLVEGPRHRAGARERAEADRLRLLGRQGQAVEQLVELLPVPRIELRVRRAACGRPRPWSPVRAAEVVHELGRRRIALEHRDVAEQRDRVVVEDPVVLRADRGSDGRRRRRAPGSPRARVRAPRGRRAATRRGRAPRPRARRGTPRARRHRVAVAAPGPGGGPSPSAARLRGRRSGS